MEASIGVFDSGIGGLTVASELRRRLPQESIVYLGDTARVPYGTKSAEAVRKFAAEDAAFLLGRGVKLLVAACHSASSVALDDLKKSMPVPVVGVVDPGARVLAAATSRGRVGVIGTTATIRSAAYERALRSLRPDIEVVAKATPLLVPLAEEGWAEDSATRSAVVEAVCREYLVGMVEEGIDALLLGCTHFPLLTRAISLAMGPGVRIVDSSAETAAAVAELLEKLSLKADSAVIGRMRVYLTDLTPGFETIGARFLGASLGEVTRVSLGNEAVG